VVDVVDVELVEPEDSGSSARAGEAAVGSGGGIVLAIDAVLEKVRREGVPVRSQVMEYAAEPRRSPLGRACSEVVPEMEGRRVPEAFIQELRSRGVKQDKAEVGAAVLCLMLGGVDEAHNLVTPHSWASPTPFGGPPKFGSPVKQEAAYAHAVVHRMEGFNPGEFGDGWNNSGYWLSNAFPTGSHAIFPKLLEEARGFAVGTDHGSREAQAALRGMGTQWSPHRFNQLCSDALECEDEELLSFCRAVQGRELALLFEHLAKCEDDDDGSSAADVEVVA